MGIGGSEPFPGGLVAANLMSERAQPVWMTKYLTKASQGEVLIMVHSLSPRGMQQEPAPIVRKQ